MTCLRGSPEAADQLRCQLKTTMQELNALIQNQSRRLDALSGSCQDDSYDYMASILQQVIISVSGAMPDLAEVYHRLTAYRDLLESLDTPWASGVSARLEDSGYSQATQQQWISSYRQVTVKQTGEQWSDQLSPEQKAAVKAYTGMAYTNINATLRGLTGNFQSEEYRIWARQLQGALQQASVPCDCVVYRGMKSEALGGLADLTDGELVGKVYTDNGFMSTSLNREDAFGGNVRLEIEVPKGAQGAYVGYIGAQGHTESEVLFNRGQYLKILSVTRDQNGCRVIRTRMMKG